jgi:protein O-GlcNAc transferase
MGSTDRPGRIGCMSAGPPDDDDAPGQDASRLIDEGNALEDAGHLEEAMRCYDAALRLLPGLARAHLNRGNILLARGDPEGALRAYAAAVDRDPVYAAAHFNIGNANIRLGRRDSALAAFRRAIALEPDFAEAEAAQGAVQEELSQLDAAAASYRRALAIDPEYFEVHSNLLFLHNYRADQTAGVMLAEARHFGEIAARRARPRATWDNVPDPDRCLRVGFVSGDFREHPAGRFAEGVLTALAARARDRLKMYAYSTQSSTDALTARIGVAFQGWYSAAGVSDEALVRRIGEDRIDVLIDLSGHTLHNRLPAFAWKPAPVQATWLGYFATTGIAAIDYLIADPWTLPPGEEAGFIERIWRLPETRLCFTPPVEREGVTDLPALREGRVTFGCFNHLTKLNDGVIALWAQVLAGVPDSRLFLKSAPIAEPSLRRNVVERLAARGIGAERLILEEASAYAQYLAAYGRVDIALDPFPYPGGATSVEALWMGVPVLTMAGASFVSRQGVGLMMNAGLPEWIAVDGRDYVARAIAHAGDLQRLAALRGGLRKQVLSSPLFDAPRFAGHFEAALRGMWQRWCAERHARGP